MIELPLYPLRKYERVAREGNYLCLYTYKSRYVLDYLESNEPSYTERRVLLLSDHNKPYKLYPIYFTVETLSQLLSAKKVTKSFYTEKGKLVNYKFTKFYFAEPYTVADSWITETGKCVGFIRGIGTLELPKYNNEKFVLLVEVGRCRVLYGYAETPIRKKIKL